jgi:hypothetical protein
MSEAPRTKPQQLAPAPHFLDRVIDSAFGRASLLEPRLLSLFEPQSVVVATAVASPSAISGRDEEQAVPARRDDRPEREAQAPMVRRDAPWSRELPPADTAPPTASRQRAAPNIQHLVNADPKLEVAAVPPARSRAHPREEETDRNALTPKPWQVMVDARRDRGRGTAQKPQSHGLDVPSGGLLAPRVISTPKAVREPTDGRAPTVVRAPGSREATPTAAEWSEHVRGHPVAPVPAVHRIIIEPPVVRHRAPREPSHAEALTPSPEPIVNVTIGRIEVRAAPALPGATRQKSQGPKPVSLDDYLKQRGGGR